MTNRNLKMMIILLLLVFVVYVVLYPPFERTDPNTPPEEDQICMKYNTAPGTLRTGLVHEMVDRYRNTQLAAINPVVQKDAHSIWFDLETLKQFVYTIEHEVKKEDPDITTDKLGVRIYYAAYPDISNWGKPGYEKLRDYLGDPATESYDGKHTLVMIPTIRITSKIKGEKGEEDFTGNFDFNPMDATSYSKGIRVMPIYHENSLTQLVGITADMESSGQNHGSLIPPYNIIQEGF